MHPKSLTVKASELVVGEHMAPPLQILSDGTSDGTIVMVHGVSVPFTRMDFYCSGGDYPSCSMSITTQEKDLNGLVVERSFNLRHSPQPAEVAKNG